MYTKSAALSIINSQDINNIYNDLGEANKTTQNNWNNLSDAYTLGLDHIHREMMLRESNKGETDHWYGVEWNEDNNPENCIAINSDGDSNLHTLLPIQSKMRRCVVKNGIVNYYLNDNNSELKEDGTPAILDGTDGNVMVEIPEFFFKAETEIINDKRVCRYKISEQGLDGFIFSPRRYTSAYEATVDRNKNILASVCTTLFTRSNSENVTTESGTYIKGSTDSYGNQKTARRNGFTNNAPSFRGGTNNSSFDNANDSTIDAEHMEIEYHTFARNQLGIPVANINLIDCRNYEDLENGIFFYHYDTQRILTILMMVEFKTRRIRKAISDGGLGMGATVYPNYNAYEAFFKPNRGISCIPCGVTNALGNNSGEVYYLMQDVPVSCTGTFDNCVFTRYADVWMPCMSYRGVENFYGHIYKIADGLKVKLAETDEYLDGHEGENLYRIIDVKYYYESNPYLSDNRANDKNYIGGGVFCPNIKCTKSVLMGELGHVLPIDCSNNDHCDDQYYCECTEMYPISNNVLHYPTFNGRIVSGSYLGYNFIAVIYPINSGTRPSDGTRLDMIF